MSKIKTTKVSAKKAPATPPEWKGGKIVLAAPTKPLRGDGHARRSFRLDCPAGELGALIWFVDKLGGYMGCHSTKTASGGQCISPEAYSLWERHRFFWMAEHKNDLAARREARVGPARDKARRRDKGIKKAAAMGGYSAQDLKDKLQKMKSILKDENQEAFALAVIGGADQWLIEAMTLEMKFSEYGVEDVGAFFKPIYDKGSSNGIGRTSFWLAVARAIEMGLYKNVPKLTRKLNLYPRTKDEFLIVAREILPRFQHVKELGICFNLNNGRSIDASSAELPVMPKLVRLEFSVYANHEFTLRLEALEKQPALKECVVSNAQSLDIAENQEPVAERVRFTIPHYVSCRGTVVARILIQSFSKSYKPSFKEGPQHLELGGFEGMTESQAALFAESNLPIEIGGNTLETLTPEAAAQFNKHRAELILKRDFSSVNLNPKILAVVAENRAGDLSLDIGDGNITEELAAALSAFKGERLKIKASHELGEKAATQLSRINANLTLIDHINSTFPRLRIKKSAAEILSQRHGKLTMRHSLGEGAGSMYGAEPLMAIEAIEVLAKRPDFDLGIYRFRRFEKKTKGATQYWEVQVQCDSESSFFKAIVTYGVVGGVVRNGRITFKEYRLHEDFNKLLEQKKAQGFMEVNLGAV